MTLYRMARESQIVQALMEAAENGKEVVALVELRARFDEQNNIDWSKQLEEAGCTVLYGFEDYKVHSKLTLITKKSAQGYSYITQDRHRQLQRKRPANSTPITPSSPLTTASGEASNVFQNLAVQKLTETSEKNAGGPAAVQERPAGRDGPGHHRRPSGPPGVHDPEEQLHLGS